MTEPHSPSSAEPQKAGWRRSLAVRLPWRWSDRALVLGLAIAEAVFLARSFASPLSSALLAFLPLAFALVMMVLVFRADRRDNRPPGTDGVLGLVLSGAAFFIFRPNQFILADGWADAAYACTILFYYGLAGWAYLSLKRSIAIVPAPRVVVRSGPYAFVRHPAYSAFLHISLCFVALSPSLRNALALAALASGIGLRVRSEERAMSSVSQYAELAANTPRRFSNGLLSLPALATIGLICFLQRRSLLPDLLQFSP